MLQKLKRLGSYLIIIVLLPYVITVFMNGQAVPASKTVDTMQVKTERDARELQTALEYKQWRRFENIINKAKDACQNSGNDVSDHFANVGKMVDIGSGATRTMEDYELSRYACYLIVQNGDSRNENMIKEKTQKGYHTTLLRFH